VCVLIGFVLKYKDYNIINNTLLEEIKNQNLELKRSMEFFQVKNRYQHMSRDELDGDGVDLLERPRSLYGFATDIQPLDDELYSSDDSSDSIQTDKTYSPSKFSDEEFITAENSRSNSVYSASQIRDSENNVHDLTGCNLSPMESRPSIMECSSPGSGPSLSVACNSEQPRQGRRPRGNRKAVSPTPPAEKRYELRSRRAVCSVKNIENETPEDFAKIVKTQFNKSSRNMAKWRMAMRAHQRQGHNYSSDDTTMN